LPNRILWESVCTSRKINLLTGDEYQFYTFLIVNCDDYGCFFGEPDILGGKLFPLKRLKDDAVRKMRDRLVEIGLAYLYVVDGETYIGVEQWEEHQRVRISRRKFPEPTEDNIIRGGSRQLAASCGELPPESNPIQSNPNPIRNPNPNPTRTGACASKHKTVYAENVTMTEEEHQKLIKEHGQEATDAMITILDNYKGANGKTYKDDYRAILNWVVKRYQEDKARSLTGAKSPLALLKELYDEEGQNEQAGNV